MKKKLLVIIIAILVILCICVKVKAEQLTNVLLDISLPEEFVDIRKQTEIQDLQTKQYYERNNIYLHATNKTNDESVTIVQIENELTKKIENLSNLNTEDFEAFLEQYNQIKNQENQTTLKQETYKVGEILFLDTAFEHVIEEKSIQTEEYYSIINGKALIISINFLEKEIDFIKVRNIIDSINIYSEDTTNNIIYLWVILIITIILIVIYIIKQKKNKINIGEHEKTNLLTNVKQYIEKNMEYDKLKGILILFIITIVLNIVSLSLGVIQGFIQYKELIEYSIITRLHVIFVIIQNIVQLLGIIYIAYLLTKRNEKTIKKIEKTFLYMLIGIVILTILRLILQIFINGTKQEFLNFIISEVKILVKSMMYILIWYLYFKNSIRVSIYYKQKTLEQIILDPKKRISI